MNKYLVGLLGLFAGFFTSCEWQKSTATLTQELVDAELKTINWNELDQFPLFDACDETGTKPEQQECFQTTLMLHLAMALQDLDLKSEKELHDTLYLDLKVDNSGGISVLQISDHALLTEENPDFLEVLGKGLKGLPRLQPALKRGIPVSAQFRVPLVLKVHD